MKPSRLRALWIPLTLGLGAVGVLAQSNAGRAFAAPGSSASASSEPKAPPPSALVGADIPTEASPAPKVSEWKDGVAVAINRGATDCHAKRLREWLRIECSERIGVSLVAGEPKGVQTWTGGDPTKWNEQTGERGHGVALIDLPLRRGQSFIATILRPQLGYDSATFGEDATFQIVWRPGWADPVIVVSTPPHSGF